MLKTTLLCLLIPFCLCFHRFADLQIEQQLTVLLLRNLEQLDLTTGHPRLLCSHAVGAVLHLAEQKRYKVPLRFAQKLTDRCLSLPRIREIADLEAEQAKQNALLAERRDSLAAEVQ